MTKFKKRIREQNVELFKMGMHTLDKELRDLDEQFNIARNLACTEWSKDPYGESLVPNKILPERTSLLRKNYDYLREEISFKRYLLAKAFMPLVLHLNRYCNFDISSNIKYWNKRIKEDEKKVRVKR